VNRSKLIAELAAILSTPVYKQLLGRQRAW